MAERVLIFHQRIVRSMASLQARCTALTTRARGVPGATTAATSMVLGSARPQLQPSVRCYRSPSLDASRRFGTFARIRRPWQKLADVSILKPHCSPANQPGTDGQSREQHCTKAIAWPAKRETQPIRQQQSTEKNHCHHADHHTAGVRRDDARPGGATSDDNQPKRLR